MAWWETHVPTYFTAFAGTHYSLRLPAEGWPGWGDLGTWLYTEMVDRDQCVSTVCCCHAVMVSQKHCCHRHRHHIAGSGRCVTPSWPHSTACLQRLEVSRPVSDRAGLSNEHRATKWTTTGWQSDLTVKGVMCRSPSELSYVAENYWQTMSSDEVHDMW